VPLTPEDLQVIYNEVERLERKVQALLDFARPAEARRQRCDLRELTGRAADLIRARARQQNVQIEAELPPEPVVADVDADQLASVLVNLFLNALDAMPQGGRLIARLERQPGGAVGVEVLDTGRGIDPAVAGRLFTPFASTKPTGTGLGLSVCRRVVAEHGGTLTGENRPGGGARFTITLPAAGEGSDADGAGRR